MAKKVIVIALVILLASYAYLAVSPRGQAVDPVNLYIDPAKIDNVALTPNTTFNVSVKIDNIPADPGLAGIQITVVWDEAILKGVSMQEIIFHEVTPPDQWSNIWQISNKVTNNSAAYAFAFQDVQDATEAGYCPINGSHTVANIILKVVGTGKSTISFSVDKLGDPQANDVAHVTTGATFSNVGAPLPAFLFVDPEKISNGSLGLGAVFSINVKIVNASDVAGLEFKLGFNASALNVQSVVKGSSIPVSDTPIIQIDNSTGFAKFNVSLSTPLNGNGSVAVFQFQVMAENVKSSPLHLYDVALVDSGGVTLPPPSTADGSFSNMKIAPGDLNHDGIVDIKDAIIFSLAFGSTPSDQAWNPEADMDGNGEVDVFDMIKIAMNFGKTA